MFTIKWIRKDGVHLIYEGSGVAFVPASEREHAHLSFILEDGGMVTIESGRVFVMNGSGRTVANYVLGTALATAKAA